MDEAPKDYEEDEVVVVKLPRKDLATLKDFLEKQTAAHWFGKRFRSHWIWVVGAGVLMLMGVYNEIKHLFVGGS